MRHALKAALLAAAIFASCGCTGLPKISPGMRTEDAERTCLRSFPPAYPKFVTFDPDGTFTKVYVQEFNGVGTHIVVKDKDGVVTAVRYIGFGGR